MQNKEAWKLYQRYVDGWKPISAEERKTLVAEVVAEDAKYITPQHVIGGRETMIEDMAAFQGKYPGGRFDVGDVSAHHDVALFTWVLVQADESVLVKGHDLIRISAEGKIAELITFAPSTSEP
ncbi:MAG: nuclear transport factor 2 family protein [Candidatus Obscuribacterales bacterium]|nr:nuclear transport factor 2 family protein [Candidatus Obscuribacterales bacterium]